MISALYENNGAEPVFVDMKIQKQKLFWIKIIMIIIKSCRLRTFAVKHLKLCTN